MKLRYFSIVNSIILIFCVSVCQAQVAIDKSTTGASSILEFGTESKGIILPKVETPTHEQGSIIYDVSARKVMYSTGTAWVDLSVVDGAVDTSNQTALTEQGNKTIIGADTSTANGILVLEDANKAMVLPQIADPQTTVQNPEAGFMCYDTTLNAVAVYNGEEWTFWTADIPEPTAEFSVVNCRDSASNFSGTITAGQPVVGVTKNVVMRADVAGPYRVTLEQDGIIFDSGDLTFTQAQVDGSTNVTVILQGSGTAPATLPVTFTWENIPGSPINSPCTFTVPQ